MKSKETVSKIKITFQILKNFYGNNKIDRTVSMT